MKSDLVSIIIPVYNAEKYLPDCLESIIKQTYTNIEIILINNGSTDRSLFLCQKYKKMDNRIIIINKKAKGVSLARNAGIKESHGKYIMFIDSDDYINSNYVEKMVYYIKKNNCPIVKSGFNIVNKDGSIKKEMYIDEKKLLTFDDVLLDYVFSYKFNSINNMLIDSKLIKNANKMYYVNECYYNYRFHDDSTTHNLKEKDIEKWFFNDIKVMYYIYNNTDKNKDIINIKCVTKLIGYFNMIFKIKKMNYKKFRDIYLRTTNRFKKIFNIYNLPKTKYTTKFQDYRIKLIQKDRIYKFYLVNKVIFLLKKLLHFDY